VHGQWNIKPIIAAFHARAKKIVYGPIYVPPTLLSTNLKHVHGQRNIKPI